MNNTTHQLFIKTYNNVKVVEIPFSLEDHCNDTGYFDGLAVFDTGLENGTRFKLHTGELNNRKVIGVVTPVGNVVFFERYTDGNHGVVCTNVPRALTGLYPSGQVDAEWFNQAVGCPEGWNPNIGQVLNNVVHQKSKFEAVTEK